MRAQKSANQRRHTLLMALCDRWISDMRWSCSAEFRSQRPKGGWSSMCYVGRVLGCRQSYTLPIIDVEDERRGRTQPASSSSHRTEAGDGQARGHRGDRSGFISLRRLRSRRRHLAATMHEQSPRWRMVCLAQNVPGGDGVGGRGLCRQERAVVEIRYDG